MVCTSSVVCLLCVGFVHKVLVVSTTKYQMYSSSRPKMYHPYRSVSVPRTRVIRINKQGAIIYFCFCFPLSSRVGSRDRRSGLGLPTADRQRASTVLWPSLWALGRAVDGCGGGRLVHVHQLVVDILCGGFSSLFLLPASVDGLIVDCHRCRRPPIGLSVCLSVRPSVPSVFEGKAKRPQT